MASEIVIHSRQVEMLPLAALKGYSANARKHPEAQIASLAAIIRDSGFTNPVLIDDDDVIIAGHGRALAAEKLKMAEVPCVRVSGLTPDQIKALRISDNQTGLLSGWDDVLLRVELSGLRDGGFDLSLTGFDIGDVTGILGGAGDPAITTTTNATLAERFGIAPFSVLNAREGWWQERKRAWLSLGIRSEVGRGENLLQMSDTMLEPDPAKRAALKGKARTFGQDLMRGEHVVGTPSLKGGLTFGTTSHPYDGQDEGHASGAGTSIFDPVLTELAYRWWSPPNGLVLDPFAGGSVRGIVAAKTGRAYVGVDLRQEQVDANLAQADQICPEGLKPAWICADSRTLDALELGPADMLFSCPPYADLEVYSDDPLDLSTLEYAEFRAAYFEIIAKACAKLKADRFACFVVGDVRDPKGAYRNFVGDTVEAFRAAGLAYYNEAILVTACGSKALRAGKQFSATRKLGKTHQNVLVFLKGDAKRATKACGIPDFGDVGEDTPDEPMSLALASDAEFGDVL
jgi:hypothetical protein